MKHLVDDIFTDAHKLIIVLDNLNTHFKKSIIDTYEKENNKVIKQIRVSLHTKTCKLAEYC
jgi:hypothetical protein